jgi:cellulose synthase/poly-beta-1,6-N-acetylglucosamine synthase-like glycosyltransferase/peptidoglycan/xylan/chitin deacetylase (PgdA/CDA1 family)
MALLQNLDERDGAWRADRVLSLARDHQARAQLADQLIRICGAERLAGVHVDLEDLDDDWLALEPIVEDLARAFRASGLELDVDVAAKIDDDVLVALARSADHVVIMAYDEHDQDGVPGPIASDSFVDDALQWATALVPANKLTAGLALYGYDWIGNEPADPISFVDAHTAAKEAHVVPHWDQSGNAHVQYADDEGHHEIWMTDAATVWNHARIAAAEHVGAVALWRLGGEDPGVWDALRVTDAAVLSTVAADPRVDNQGNGPFLSLSLSPEPGERTLHVTDDRIADEQWLRSPSPYLVRRAGIGAGQVALTFDDGPDSGFTPLILDLLKREQVPATFFVVGKQAAQSPALVRRAFAEGHEIGNHSFTHPNVDTVGDLRLRTELESTSRLIESLIGRRPLLYRPPSLADIEPRTAAGAAAFARAGALGYIVVDADIDPRDWEQSDPDVLVQKTLDQAADGGVILLHDGGGDRGTTLRALPQLIGQLRARGLQFVPLSQLINKKRDDVMPPTPSRTSVVDLITRMLLAVGLRVVHAFDFALWITLILICVRAVLMPLAAVVSAYRRRLVPRGPLPSVTALVPAYNEEPVISRTVDSLLASDVPLEVVVVDDGSTDGTADLVLQRYRREPRVRLIRQANAGKAAALRSGFNACRTEVVVALDGDTIFAPDTVRRLIEPLCDPAVGAVAGTAEVGNIENELGRWQAIEYLTQQEIERRAWDLAGALPIVPGAVGAWRRRAVLRAGGFSSDTLAEDADMAMALCRHGWRVVHASRARARTEAPTTLRTLVKQRVRWSFGILQALWRHRGSPAERRAGWFGRLVWPSMLTFQTLVPVLTPLALLALAVALLAGNVRPALITAAVLFGVEILQFVIAAMLARDSGASGLWRLVPALITSRLFYRALLLGVMLRSIGRLFDGVPVDWEKLTRRNTVIAYAAITRASGARS